MRKIVLLALVMTLVACAANRYPSCPTDDFGFCDRHSGEVFYSIFDSRFDRCRCPG